MSHALHQTHQQSNLQIYQMFTSLFITISKGQQIIDSIKQVLTTYQLFHPLVLFKYLTKGNPVLTRKHIIDFLQENNYLANQEDIKIIFSFEGIKDKMNYSTFLKMIYPYGMSANREINSAHVKNYYATQKLNVSQQTLACFYLLLTEHIQLINRIEVQKQDSLDSIPKEKINKVIRNIKKLSQKSSNHCEEHPYLITSLELMYFIKNFTDIEDSSLFYLIRRLGTDHLGNIEIEKLQSFIKPWKKRFSKTQQNQNNDFIEEKQNIMEESLNVSIQKKFNQEKYKKQLNAQLSRNVSQKKAQSSTRRKNRKQGTIKIKQGQFCNKKKLNYFTGTQSSKKQSKNMSPLKTPIKQFNKEAKPKQKQSSRPNGNNVKLFMKFIETFLKNCHQIQPLKNKLNKNSQINYLKIFKSLDKKERGVITAQQLQDYYQEIGGVSVSINFNVLINAFSLTSQNWLSYSQFCQILKPSIQRSISFSQKQGHDNLSSSNRQYIGIHQQNRAISQLIYLNLLNEYQLLQIRRQFSKKQLFHLFTLINKQQTGFINYQQLKQFLYEINFQQISMYELMLILKRLDRSKNGVVSENQFVSYFLVEM